MSYCYVTCRVGMYMYAQCILALIHISVHYVQHTPHTHLTQSNTICANCLVFTRHFLRLRLLRSLLTGNNQSGPFPVQSGRPVSQDGA